MIEIEKKVILTKEKLDEIIKKASFIKEVRIQDSYFDTLDYKYTSNNTWIRKRDENFEVKVGLSKRNSSFNQYEELIDLDEIYKFFNIKEKISIENFFKKNKIFKFISFLTIRKKYKLGEFILDIDLANYKDCEYRICEVELLVDNKDKVVESVTEPRINRKL